MLCVCLSGAEAAPLPTEVLVGWTRVSRCWTTSCSRTGPRLSWFRSSGAFRQRENFSLAPVRFPALRDAIPQACHTPLGSRPLLVDTSEPDQTSVIDPVKLLELRVQQQ